MAEELELKLTLAPKDASRLARAPLLQTARQRQRAYLSSIYYDTPELALRAEGLALRVRRQKRTRILTIKSRGEGLAGLTRRPEWETTFYGHFDFSMIEDATIRERLDALSCEGKLIPVFETRFWRTTWLVEPAQAVRIEIALDRGFILAGPRREAICELELERLAGKADALFDSARALAKHCALFPEGESKADRGYRLAAHEPRLPLKTRCPPLPGDTPARAACAEALHASFAQIVANRPGALTGEDPEYLHELRVALRRLRVALAFFAPLLPATEREHLVSHAKAFMQVLGNARESDVLAHWLARQPPVFPEDPSAMEAVAAWLSEVRSAARQACRESLASREWGEWVIAGLAFAHRLGEAKVGADETATLAPFAEKRIAKLQRRLMRRALRAGKGRVKGLHRLRLAVKRLRYALEYCAPDELRERFDQTMKRLAKLQDRLGRLQDLAVFQKQLGALIEQDPGCAPTARCLAARAKAERRRLLSKRLGKELSALFEPSR